MSIDFKSEIILGTRPRYVWRSHSLGGVLLWWSTHTPTKINFTKKNTKKFFISHPLFYICNYETRMLYRKNGAANFDDLANLLKGIKDDTVLCTTVGS